MDAFFLILAITLFLPQNFLLSRIIINKRLFRIEIVQGTDDKISLTWVHPS
jgi:hypothetical protein